MATDSFAHHGIFAHQHHSLATQRQTDGLHLFGAYVVGTHNETSWVVIQKLLITRFQLNQESKVEMATAHVHLRILTMIFIK